MQLLAVLAELRSPWRNPSLRVEAVDSPAPGLHPRSPFGWHFSPFRQRRSLTAGAAPQLKDREVQLQRCTEPRVARSKACRRTAGEGGTSLFNGNPSLAALRWSALRPSTPLHLSPKGSRCQTTEEQIENGFNCCCTQPTLQQLHHGADSARACFLQPTAPGPSSPWVRHSRGLRESPSETSHTHHGYEELRR